MSTKAKPGGPTVGEALSRASSFWLANENSRSKRGCNMMPIRARICADILGHSKRLSSLGVSDGASLLIGLSKRGLERSTVKTYYAAGKRMLQLAGVSLTGWPNAPTPPRKLREPIDAQDIDRMVAWLASKGWPDTAALVCLMRDTGLRVEVEALNGQWIAHGGRLDVVSGKGGHGRAVPYRGPETGPLRESGGITYEGHLRRIKAGNAALGTHILPHDLRRHFIRAAYLRSGNNIRTAQVLAGHSDPGTTAGYIGVNWEELCEAVG